MEQACAIRARQQSEGGKAEREGPTGATQQSVSPGRNAQMRCSVGEITMPRGGLPPVSSEKEQIGSIQRNRLRFQVHNICPLAKAPLPRFLAIHRAESKVETGRKETRDHFPSRTGGISAAERCCRGTLRLSRVAGGTAQVCTRGGEGIGQQGQIEEQEKGKLPSQQPTRRVPPGDGRF